MVIKVNKNAAPLPMADTVAPPPPPVSPHGKAAEAFAMTTQTAQMDTGAPAVTETAIPVQAPVKQSFPDCAWVTAEVGFKMPVAPYTMLEVRAGVTLPSALDEIDATFQEAYDWAEGRINEIVQAQQEQMGGDV